MTKSSKGTVAGLAHWEPASVILEPMGRFKGKEAAVVMRGPVLVFPDALERFPNKGDIGEQERLETSGAKIITPYVHVGLKSGVSYWRTRPVTDWELRDPSFNSLVLREISYAGLISDVYAKVLSRREKIWHSDVHRLMALKVVGSVNDQRIHWVRTLVELGDLIMDGCHNRQVVSKCLLQLGDLSRLDQDPRQRRGFIAAMRGHIERVKPDSKQNPIPISSYLGSLAYLFRMGYER